VGSARSTGIGVCFLYLASKLSSYSLCLLTELRKKATPCWCQIGVDSPMSVRT
jgi:hypothetical protein